MWKTTPFRDQSYWGMSRITASETPSLRHFVTYILAITCITGNQESASHACYDFIIKHIPGSRSCKIITVDSCILAHANTHQPVAQWSVTVGVEGHALVSRTGGRCTEVRRTCITTPMVTLLVTLSVTGDEEARVE